MNDIPVDPKIWKLATQILTQKQMNVLELREKNGYSWNQLAITFNCTRSNVREIHRAATKNLHDAIEHAGGIDEALELQAITHGSLAGLPQPRRASEKKEIA